MLQLPSVRRWARSRAATYRHGEERPLAGYLVLLGFYAAGAAAAEALIRMLNRTPARWSPWELTQLALATQKVSRLIAKDAITSPLRTPFTSYEGAAAPGEVSEQVRTHNSLVHSLGELITCPFCLTPWVATAFATGVVLAPETTRRVMPTFAAGAVSDYLQSGYAIAQQASGEAQPIPDGDAVRSRCCHGRPGCGKAKKARKC
jgi:hypothetical protein